MSRNGLSLAGRHDAAHRHDPPAAAPAADRVHLERLFLDNLHVIEAVVRFVCRRHKLSTSEIEEFASEVKLKILERDYDVLRRFEGRSSLRTYLTVVIGRLYLDYRNQQWGKWRPSAEARRLGPIAIQLETLMVRDGRGFGEAARHLLQHENVGATEDQLQVIAMRLPVRMRRVMVGELALEATASEIQADQSALLADRRAAAVRIALAVRAAVGGLAPQEQVILRLRFLELLSIAEIARVLHLESKPLYRRLETVMKCLRLELLRAGVNEGDVREVFDGTAGDISLALMWTPAAPGPEGVAAHPRRATTRSSRRS